MKQAIVIVPTYNEKENIKKLIPILFDVFKTITTWQIGVLVVDDTSPDKTYQVVKDLQKKYRQLHLLVNPQKSGLGGAYMKGMKHAFSHLKADVVFEFDADLSHDPQKIPAFLEKIDQGNDMVLGSRYIKGGGIPQNWGLHRKFLSVIGNLIIMSVFTNFKIRDWTGGYRCIKKKVFEAVVPELESDKFTGYTFQIGFLYLAVKKGFAVAEVPFHFVDRTHGYSKLGSEYLRNALWFVISVRLRDILNNRIFKFAVVGAVGASVQLLTLQLWRSLFFFQLAFFLSIESAIVSNFIWSNLWTFADRKLKAKQIPSKFVQFNLASAGSIVIQQLIAVVGEFGIGLFTLFTLPIVGIDFDTGTLYAIVGIIVGMFWNFFAYSRFIWKKKSA